MALKPIWQKIRGGASTQPAKAGPGAHSVCADDGFLRAADPADPRHIAVIMDGNGRWAEKRHLPRKAGHHEGAEALRRLVEACLDRGIPYLTVFAFSSENWSRSQEEIDDLMDLLRRFMKKDVEELKSRGVRAIVIGDRERLDEDIQRRIAEAEEQSRDLNSIIVTLAVSYGGRAELVAAAKALAQDVAAGTLQADGIDEAAFAGRLFTGHLPDPDLLIRTSGEQRISNFMLWQLAYTEFAFLDVLWPDFNADYLAQAIQIYRNRDRRFGGRAERAGETGAAHDD